MTTTDKDQRVEVAYQIGPGRTASRKFSAAFLRHLSTLLVSRRAGREGGADPSTATVIAFLTQLLTKTPSIDEVADDSTLCYRISTATATIRGDRLAQVDAIAAALHLAIKTYRPRRKGRPHPVHRQSPQDVAARPTDRPVLATPIATRPVPDYLRQLYYRSSTLSNPHTYRGARIRSIPMGGATSPQVVSPCSGVTLASLARLVANPRTDPSLLGRAVLLRRRTFLGGFDSALALVEHWG